MRRVKFSDDWLTVLALVVVFLGACSAVCSVTIRAGDAHVRMASDGAVQGAAAERDGQHDFDFEIGTWKTHLRRLQHPLANSTTWVEFDGTSVVRKVWGGRANLVELKVDGPAGSLQGLSLRLYNPQSHQWSLNFANIKTGALGEPTVGEFRNGQGEFFDQESFNGRMILVRGIFSDITPNSYRFEQAFSQDGGRTWEVNWIATDTRVSDGLASSSGSGGAEKNIVEHNPAAAVEAGSPSAATRPDGQHDFDFNFGKWKTHISRLQNPLTGSTTWAEYEGISVVSEVFGGRASLLELEAGGPAGHIEGVGLRLYNPQSHQWSLNWANGSGGTIGQPMVGEFRNGRGEFFDQENFNGRAIYVRNGFSEITPDSSHFEQAFSDDGGRTWEVNWIMTFTRAKEPPEGDL